MKTKPLKLRNLEQLSKKQQVELEAAFNESEPTFNASLEMQTSEIDLETLQTMIETGVTQKRIGNLLEQARTHVKLSGRETARRVKVNHSWIRRLENADTNLELSSIVRVAHALGFEISLKLEARDDGRVLEAKL